MGSNGSVIPYFIEQIKAGGPITITDRRMTRFFLTLEEAIELLFKAAIASSGGETFVMNMPACSIVDVADALMEHYGRVEVVETGMRPGEKLDEMLVSKHEASLSYCYDQNYFVIVPPKDPEHLKKLYSTQNAFPYQEFSSRTKEMSRPELTAMLRKGGFL